MVCVTTVTLSGTSSSTNMWWSFCVMLGLHEILISRVVDEIDAVDWSEGAFNEV